MFARVLEWLFDHRGKVFGSLLGLLLGWMIAAYGLWKTLFIAACLFAGYIVGMWLDDGPPGRRMSQRRRR